MPNTEAWTRNLWMARIKRISLCNAHIYNAASKRRKLIMTLPNFPTSSNQRYVTVGYETPIASDENIIEYCKTPRRKKEIQQHFALSSFQLRQHLEPLIAAYKLRGTDPQNPKNHWQRYASANVVETIRWSKL